MESSYKINRLHKINKRRNTPFTTITIVIFILGYVVLWFISKPQGLWGWAYLIDTVLVLICIYAALIAKGFKKIILYTLVIIFILGSVIIASLGPIEQMEEGILNDLEEIINVLPDIKKIGFRNWIDTFSLQTRLTNFYGPEQARVDNYIIS